ncbi:hypothetical protein BH09PSE2_BH09PSE2_13870 [soil metagenome]
MNENFRRTLYMRDQDGELSELMLTFERQPDGTSDEDRQRGLVLIAGKRINFRVKGWGRDGLQMMYRLLSATDEFIRSECEHQNATIFHFEPGDAEGVGGVFFL